MNDVTGQQAPTTPAPAETTPPASQQAAQPPQKTFTEQDVQRMIQERVRTLASENESLKQQASQYEPSLQTHIERITAKVPEEMKPLLSACERMSTIERFNFLSKNETLLTGRTKSDAQQVVNNTQPEPIVNTTPPPTIPPFVTQTPPQQTQVKRYGPKGEYETASEWAKRDHVSYLNASLEERM